MKVIRILRNVVYDRAFSVRHFRSIRKYRETPVSIISSDCLGGVIYHDMHQKFLSPTINICFEGPSPFCLFAKNLGFYLTRDIVQEDNPSVAYPIGRIVGNEGNPDVLIHFVHDSSFENASKKWRQRAERVMQSKVVVVLSTERLTSSDVRDFDAIPFPKRIYYGVAEPSINCPYARQLPYLYRHGMNKGKWLSFKKWPIGVRNVPTPVLFDELVHLLDE